MSAKVQQKLDIRKGKGIFFFKRSDFPLTYGLQDANVKNEPAKVYRELVFLSI